VRPLVAVGQAVVGGAGDRIGVQGAGEVPGLDHNTGLGIDFHLYFDRVAGHDAGGLSVGVAEAEQVATPHDGHPALPRMPIDRDGHRRPLACTERLHNI
jgi:hypothetical protein